jgi:hypothetical protein
MNLTPGKFRAAKLISIALIGSAITPALAQNRDVAAADVEEIYIVRSVAESRAPPTEFCSKARSGVSDAIAENQHTFRSVATRTSDARVVDANVNTIGSIHTCFGRTSNPAVVEFYGDILLGRTAIKGFGECVIKSDFPEQGLNVSRCFLELSDLPGDYIGGRLTTNSVTSRTPLGTESDPTGFTQSSIATIRLWRKRAGG